MKENLEFDNQRKDEEIILLSRRHPWVLAKTGLIIVGIILIVLIAFLSFGASFTSSIVLVAALIFIIIYCFIRWFVYTNDIYILTNQRIINIDQGGFFTRRVSEAELENIQNVTYEIKGPTRSFLNFGNILIATAGSDNPGLTLKNVENPHFVQEKIINLQKKSQQKGRTSFASKNIIR